MTSILSPAGTCHGEQPSVDYKELENQQLRADQWDDRLAAWTAGDALPDLRDYLTEAEREEYRGLKESFDFSDLTAEMVYDRICELECLARLRYRAQILETERLSDYTCGI